MLRYQIAAMFVAVSLILVPTRVLTRPEALAAPVLATQRDNPIAGTYFVTEGALSKPSAHTPTWIAYTYLDQMRKPYGLRQPKKEMIVRRIARHETGGYTVHMEQQLHGRPVFGGELALRIDAEGVIRRVEGTVYPQLASRVFKKFPALSVRRAEQKARASYKGAGQLRAQPVTSLYYLPARAGVPLVYDFTFQVEGAADSQAIYRAQVHAVMGHVLK
ncbi:hypothetical protein [Paenibacillus xanthanilyticus]|uniref:FTP domain-containing protein n=1 Tax=Paenibacillus xanthanilyticus TaxID=1783531 RepID=A0ABV8JZR1_9BACL